MRISELAYYLQRIAVATGDIHISEIHLVEPESTHEFETKTFESKLSVCNVEYAEE